jgi:poly(3-hydroxybutyrate) depolymerase
MKTLAILTVDLWACDGAYAVPSPGCKQTPTITSTNYTMQVNNKSREYYVKLPENYDKNHPYRLVFTLHALGGTATDVVQGGGGYLPFYGLPPLANNTAIFVVPNGINGGWGNAGGEDIMFIDQLLKLVEGDLCVDQSLRFSTGFSYGAAVLFDRLLPSQGVPRCFSALR